MNHIKRKFRYEVQMTAEEFETNSVQLVPLGNKESAKKYRPEKGQKCYVHTASDKAIEAFPLKLNGKTYYIPEPDPVLVYFDSSQRQYRDIMRGSKEVLVAFDIEQAQTFPLDVHKVYVHFELCAVFITSLFTAIEAFMNKIIPENYVFSDPKSNRTEVYDKNQIQRHIAFETKMKRIIREVTNKDFVVAYPLKMNYINNLKDFRDAIIHTKTSTEGHTPYEYLFKSSFSFKYEETLHAVRDFINFYSPGLIEDCECGGNF